MLQRLKSWLASAGVRRRGETSAVMPLAVPAARTPLEIALSAGPDDADLNYRMGLTHLAGGDAAGALDYFHLALHYAPELFPACAGRVSEVTEMRKWPRSEAK